MQIEPSQPVWHVTGPTGPGDDHPRRYRHDDTAIFRVADARQIEAAEQAMQRTAVSAVAEAQNDLLAGRLETDAAFQAAAEAMLLRGV